MCRGFEDKIGMKQAETGNLQRMLESKPPVKSGGEAPREIYVESCLSSNWNSICKYADYCEKARDPEYFKSVCENSSDGCSEKTPAHLEIVP